MNLLMLAHILAALLTVVFAVYTFFFVFQKYSMQHRINNMSNKMAPLIISKIPKKQVVEKLVKEGHDEKEVSELHDKLSANFTPNKQK